MCNNIFKDFNPITTWILGIVVCYIIMLIVLFIELFSDIDITDAIINIIIGFSIVGCSIIVPLSIGTVILIARFIFLELVRKVNKNN